MTDELLKGARNFCTACTNIVAIQFSKIKNSFLENSFSSCIGRLMSSLDLTTDDIFFLLEQNRYWDVPILFRSLLEGTARCLYLLSAPCREEEAKRLDEYLNILPKKEWASLEQAVSKLNKGASLHDSDSLESILVDSLNKVILDEKTGNGESKKVSEVAARWKFKELSTALRAGCPQWAVSADLWEYKYVTANPLVHKSGMGCRYLGEETKQITTYYDSSSITYAAPMLISSAILLFDRLFVFSEKFNLDSRPLLMVMKQNIPFFTEAASVEGMAQEAIRSQMEKMDFPFEMNAPFHQEGN